MTVSLRPSQIEDLSIAIANPRSFNFSEPGTGKTPIFCAYAWHMWSTKGKKTIIVQPNHLRSKNRLETIRFSGFKPNEVVVLEKASDYLGPRQRLGTDACQETGFIDYIDDPDAKVFCVGFTFLKNNWKHMIECHPEIDLVVVDEGHLGYKTHDSKASLELYGLMKNVERLYYATGTPIDGRLDSCFTAMHLIEPRYYGSYRGFLAQHAGFIDDYGKVMYWVEQEKVTKILNKHSVRRLWTEVHGEIKRNVTVIDDLEMRPKMKEAYEEFEMMAFVELDGMLLDGSNPGVATMRARQIINCPQTFGIEEKSAKQEYVEGIAEAGTVVFSSMPAEVEANAALLRSIGLEVGVMHGGISDKERNRVDVAYQAGELDCICATPAVSSTGWNWQRTKNIIYTSLDYMDSNLEQSIKRGERELRDEPLNIWFLEYKNSVDQKVRKIVYAKENLTESVMGGVKGQT